MNDMKKVTKTVFCDKIKSNVKMVGTYKLEPRKEYKPNGEVFYIWRLCYIEITCPKLKDSNCYDGNDCIAHNHLTDILPY